MMCLLCPSLQKGYSAGSATEAQEGGWMSASVVALTLSSCAARRSLSKPQITISSCC